MPLPSDSAPINQLTDALAHSEESRRQAVEEALQHGTEHLKAREQQRRSASAAARTDTDGNGARG